LEEHAKTVCTENKITTTVTTTTATTTTIFSFNQPVFSGLIRGWTAKQNLHGYT